MEHGKKQVLAIYDVRGIQDYIFKTPKVKDAIGASYAIEAIIDEALSYAVEQMGLEKEDVSLVWCTEDGPCSYVSTDVLTERKRIEVLFIGGGNAYVLFEDKELCVSVNRLMSKYVLEQTYSLQLAVAMVEKGDVYANDYEKLRAELVRVKENMLYSAPVAALPIMQIELNTGYPLAKGKLVDEEAVSTETYGKKVRERRLRKGLSESEKSFGEIVFEKGSDSTLAVVHMDGNNMGLRIKSLVQGITDYTEAINLMRKISYYINHSYQCVFEKMMNFFNANGKQRVIKVLVAGDDITYVCTGRFALSTVEYFCKEMAGYTMLGKHDCNNKEHEEKIKKYGFSVCAGIAYMGGHFPFHIAYEVAEECCGSAKERAKSKECMECEDGMERVLNFVDFQICKNVQATDLEVIRENEYVTASGEQLCIRPYYIHTDADYSDKNVGSYYDFARLKGAIEYFKEEKNIPRSFAKELRNTYSVGENRVRLFQNFLQSRGWKMPNESNDSYLDTPQKTAAWYDALELLELNESVKDA